MLGVAIPCFLDCAAVRHEARSERLPQPRTARSCVSAPLDPARRLALICSRSKGDPRQGAEKPLAIRQRGNPLNLNRFAPA